MVNPIEEDLKQLAGGQSVTVHAIPYIKDGYSGYVFDFSPRVGVIVSRGTPLHMAGIIGRDGPPFIALTPWGAIRGALARELAVTVSDNDSRPSH